ncbi:MAG: hypothetical protein FJZ56_05490 [Chlamydiae bacterium]|nr:hypothetical protein [Chlamydiota bacterium]
MWRFLAVILLTKAFANENWIEQIEKIKSYQVSGDYYHAEKFFSQIIDLLDVHGDEIRAILGDRCVEEYAKHASIVPKEWKYNKIYITGDSHSAFCYTTANSWRDFLDNKYEAIHSYHTEDHKIQNIDWQVHLLGPRTMHRVGRDGFCQDRFNPSFADVVVFVFGEIDVRKHIGRQIYLQKRDLEEIVEILAKSYIKSILDFASQTGSIPVIAAVVPPNKPYYCLEGNSGDPFCPTVPLEERVVYTKKLNACLEKMAKENHILFFHPFTLFTNEDGTMNNQYSDGIHILVEYNLYIRNRLVAFLTNDT